MQGPPADCSSKQEGTLALMVGQNIQDVAIWVHGSPQILDVAIDLDQDFIEMPLVTGLRTAAASVVSKGLAKLEASVANSLAFALGHTNDAIQSATILKRKDTVPAIPILFFLPPPVICGIVEQSTMFPVIGNTSVIIFYREVRVLDDTFKLQRAFIVIINFCRVEQVGDYDFGLRSHGVAACGPVN